MSSDGVTIGTAHVKCPECDVVLPIPVSAQTVRDEDGTQRLDFESDMADVWAHAWTHTDE